jgi:hypothetical protein
MPRLVRQPSEGGSDGNGVEPQDELLDFDATFGSDFDPLDRSNLVQTAYSPDSVPPIFECNDPVFPQSQKFPDVQRLSAQTAPPFFARPTGAPGLREYHTDSQVQESSPYGFSSYSPRPREGLDIIDPELMVVRLSDSAKGTILNALRSTTQSTRLTPSRHKLL